MVNPSSWEHQATNDVANAGIEPTTKPAHAPDRQALQDSALQQIEVIEAQTKAPGRGPSAAIFTSVTGVTGISSLLAGVVIVALPRMGEDLSLPPPLLLWPASIYALTCGCALILSGAIADVVGSRPMYILGCLLQSAFSLACGLAQTSFQIIFFRALAGIASAFCLPSAVSLITTYFPHGRRRNMAFACMGGGQPVGFGIGLVVGGFLVDSSAGWRGGFYIAAGINTIIFLITIFGLPKIHSDSPRQWSALLREVDRIGALILSASLGLLSYDLAVLTGSVSSIHEPAIIATLCTALALIPSFYLWIRHQTHHGRPAIIPNSLWRNQTFTTICINVFLLWGAFNAGENLFTFFFQSVQHLTATQASIRFLPAPVVGLSMNMIMGAYIHKMRANWTITLATLITCIAPILTATMGVKDSYWEFVFPAMTLNCIAPDVLFTASNLIITDAFPGKTQALAGGVFNTVAQIGKSVGIALTAVIANGVSSKLDKQRLEQEQEQGINGTESTGRGGYVGSHGPTASSDPAVLMQGYRAAWWFTLGITAISTLVSLWGLRNMRKLGLKRE